MKKVILCAVLLVALSACSHSAGKGMGTTTNLDSNVIPTFEELSIDYGQAVSPQWVNELVVIKNTPQIERIITRGSWGEEGTVALQEVCKAIVPLKQDEYDDILQFIVDADLEGYAPPEDCEVMVGSTGVTLDYKKTDGMDYGFHTLCELEAEIDALVNAVSDLADELIDDCDISMADFSSEEQDSDEETSGEEAPEEKTQEE